MLGHVVTFRFREPQDRFPKRPNRFTVPAMPSALGFPAPCSALVSPHLVGVRWCPAVASLTLLPSRVPRPWEFRSGLLRSPCGRGQAPPLLSYPVCESQPRWRTLWNRSCIGAVSQASLLFLQQHVKVKSLEDVEKNPRAIDAWIGSISELHRSKPPATVHYTRSAMPPLPRRDRGNRRHLGTLLF